MVHGAAVSTVGARQAPMYDAVSHLVQVISGGDVQNTIVNGQMLMRDRKVLTLNGKAILAEGRSWIERVRAAIK